MRYGNGIMLKIAVCDDEQLDIEHLTSIISKYCAERQISYIIDKYSTGPELLNCCKRYTVIFLDIKMQNLDGINLAQRIRAQDKHVKIIFVTNFENYRSDAFTVRAFGYVVKPYSPDVIFRQLNDVIDYSIQERRESTVTFDTDQGIKTMNADDIYYAEAWSHKIKIHYKENFFIINDTIVHILSAIQIYGFSMPHKSFIVNMNHVSHIIGYDIYLTNGSVIPMSQKRAVQFKKEFHAFLKSNFNTLNLR